MVSWVVNPVGRYHSEDRCQPQEDAFLEALINKGSGLQLMHICVVRVAIASLSVTACVCVWGGESVSVSLIPRFSLPHTQHCYTWSLG